MDAFMDIKRAALVWNVTERRVNELCKKGRIEGAHKENGRWLIPVNAEKPTDKRYKISPLPPINAARLLPLPIGITDFKKASTEYFYVDKTLLIRDLLDEKTQVSVFSRPKRFGKSLNMDMLRTFFEFSPEDNSVYFRDYRIWNCGDEYKSYQGRFPVIFLNFKDAIFDNWSENFNYIRSCIYEEFDRFEIERPDNIGYSLAKLTQAVHEKYHIAPVVIIDEYDTPVLTSKIHGFFDEAQTFINTLYSGGFKDNKHLSYGILSGVLALSGDVKTFTLLDKKYNKYFGFTEEEVRRICDYYNRSEEYEKIIAWYDGYGNKKEILLNPWSVINCMDEECRPRLFWSGSENTINKILTDADSETITSIELLMQGKSFITHIDTRVIYPDIKKDPSSVYSYLLMNGYLKAITFDRQFDGSYMCEVTIPNKEIATAYSKEILEGLEYIIPKTLVISIREALFAKNIEVLSSSIADFLNNTTSLSEVSDEAAYHVVTLGLSSLMANHYYFKFMRRQLSGNYGVQMTPLEERLPAIMIEMVSVRNSDENELERIAYAAVDQIMRMQYDPETKLRFNKQVIKYGVAFDGRNSKVVWE